MTRKSHYGGCVVIIPHAHQTEQCGRPELRKFRFVSTSQYQISLEETRSKHVFLQEMLFLYNCISRSFSFTLANVPTIFLLHLDFYGFRKITNWFSPLHHQSAESVCYMLPCIHLFQNTLPKKSEMESGAKRHQFKYINGNTPATKICDLHNRCHHHT